MNQREKLVKVHHEIKRFSINILGVSEVRCPETGELHYETAKFIYSEDKHESGVASDAVWINGW